MIVGIQVRVFWSLRARRSLILIHQRRPLLSGVVQTRCIIYLRMIHVHNGIYHGLVRYELVFLNEVLLIVWLIYWRHRSCVSVCRMRCVRVNPRGGLRLQLHLLDLRLDLHLGIHQNACSGSLMFALSWRLPILAFVMGEGLQEKVLVRRRGG